MFNPGRRTFSPNQKMASLKMNDAKTSIPNQFKHFPEPKGPKGGQ